MATLRKIGLGVLAIVALCSCQKKTKPPLPCTSIATGEVIPNKPLTSQADLISAFGWTTPEQQEAFCSLLKRAYVELETRNLSTKQDTDEIVDWLMTLIEETQEKFWNRKGGRERWQAFPLPWMHFRKEDTFALLSKLGFVQAVEPEPSSAGVVCLLGASRGRMQNRVQFLKDLIQQQKLKPTRIYLLSGDRPAVEKIDGPVKELKKVAAAYGYRSWRDITEMDMLRYLVEKDPLFQHYEVIVVNTHSTMDPKGTIRRPTTQSTIVEWIKSDPPVGPVFFISNQPYVQSQEAGILSVLIARNILGYDVKTLGAAFEGTPTPELIKQGVEAAGGAIYALAPLALRACGTRLSLTQRRDFTRIYLRSSYANKVLSKLIG